MAAILPPHHDQRGLGPLSYDWRSWSVDCVEKCTKKKSVTIIVNHILHVALVRPFSTSSTRNAVRLGSLLETRQRLAGIGSIGRRSGRSSSMIIGAGREGDCVSSGGLVGAGSTVGGRFPRGDD